MTWRERRVAADGGKPWLRAIARYVPVFPPHAAGSFSPGIHGARGLFAMLVVVFHAANSGLPVWTMPHVVQEGLESLKFGVELFFAISGFVIIGTLGRAKSAGQFLLNRATRIYSVLWVLLPIFVVISLVSGRGRMFELSETEFVFVFIGNMFTLAPLVPIPVLYGPAWTLCYEFTFYFLCFLFLFGRQYLRVDLRLPLVVLGLVVIAIQPRTLFFLSGVIVASGLLDRRLPRWTCAEPAIWVVVFLAMWQAASADSSPYFRPVYEWSLAQWASRRRTCRPPTGRARGPDTGSGGT